MSHSFASRNDALGFAQRTRRNLEFLEGAYADGQDVHVVTQLINSLLGLVVMPTERKVLSRMHELHLADLYQHGWPHWQILIGSSDTLAELTTKLRNAAAHSNVHFSSDSREPTEVEIEAWNFRRKEDKNPNWRARITAPDLRLFCFRLTDLIEQTIG